MNSAREVHREPDKRLPTATRLALADRQRVGQRSVSLAVDRPRLGRLGPNDDVIACAQACSSTEVHRPVFLSQQTESTLRCLSITISVHAHIMRSPSITSPGRTTFIKVRSIPSSLCPLPVAAVSQSEHRSAGAQVQTPAKTGMMWRMNPKIELILGGLLIGLGIGIWIGIALVAGKDMNGRSVGPSLLLAIVGGVSTRHALSRV